MRLTAIRAFGVAAVASLTLLVTPTAYACNYPTLDVYPENPGPGDQVSFWLTNLTGGAEYSVNVEGIEVVPTRIAGGTAPVQGSFKMPDLGSSSREVTVQAKVAHPDIADGTGSASPPDNVTYTIPAGPTPSTPVQEPTQERHASSPTDTQTSAGRGGSPHRPARRGTDQPSPSKPTGPQRSSPGLPATQPVEVDGTGSGAGRSDAALATPTSAQSASAAEPAQPRGARSTARRDGAVAGPPVPAPLRRLLAADGAARVATAGDDVPLGAEIAFGVLLVAGMAGGGWAFVRARSRRPAPEPEAAHAAAPLEPERLDLDAELERLVSGDFATIDVEAELERMIAGELRAVDSRADTASEPLAADARRP